MIKKIPRIDEYTYLICMNCNLVSCYPFPGNEELNNFYKGFLFNKPSTASKSMIKRNEIKQDVEKIIEHLRMKNDIKIPKDFKVLDYGGGIGFYSYAFTKLGYEVTLVDKDEEALNYAKKKFPNIYQIKNLDDLDPFTDKYDLIYCNQVIEHVTDPDQFLKSLKTLLNYKGTIILTTPNQMSKEYLVRFDWLIEYLLKTSGLNVLKFIKSFLEFIKTPWICCDPPRHLFSFNLENFQILLHRNNFIIIDIFTEISTEQVFSKKKYKHNYYPTSIKSYIRNTYNILIRSGLKILKKLDNKRRYGNNLVAIIQNN
jgi:2-polyprenyl-3-methyl-5-hydroxy-6-metoxy-1,4-benzoquinol methylase